MRCTSSGSRVRRVSARSSGAPKVRLGTKRPSITSTWTHSAPPRSIAASSSPSRPRSAERIDGAMRAVTGAPGWGSVADDEIDARLARAQHPARGALVHHDADLPGAPQAGRDGAHAEPGGLEPLAGGPPPARAPPRGRAG